MFHVISSIDINEPIRAVAAVGTKSSFVLLIGTFE